MPRRKGSILSIVRLVFLSSLILLFAWKPNAAAQDDPEPEYPFEIEDAFPNVKFTFPVDLANDGVGFLYVVERAGRIYSFPNDSLTADTTLFLDIREKVFDDDNEIESGLLSISFHPDYEVNGYCYVYYVAGDPLRSVLARYTRSEDDPRGADPNSELVILEFDQPSPRHNGGDSAFDTDGYLYLSLGDGSTGEDLFGNGQNLETLLGSIIRIDVDNPEGGKNYGIPPDNPFAGNVDGIREEIYAYGFRNPWRFSIDPESGHIWAGDVGELSWEEVDFVIKGGNYGWPITEGSACFDPNKDCSDVNLIPPVHSYGHHVGRSVTGGFVYRGLRVPELRGKYIFTDWSARQIWALSYDGNPHESDEMPHIEQIAVSRGSISSFGVDENGELYMLFTWGNAKVMRFVESTPSNTNPGENPFSPQVSFRAEGPNPFSDGARFSLEAGVGDYVHVAVFDVLGREIDVMFSGVMASGTVRELKFDGSRHPNGVYFFRAQHSGGFITRTMILSR